MNSKILNFIHRDKLSTPMFFFKGEKICNQGVNFMVAKTNLLHDFSLISSLPLLSSLVEKIKICNLLLMVKFENFEFIFRI